MNLFDQLLAVKSARRDTAERTMLAQSRVHAGAVRAREEAQHRAEDYREIAYEGELRIYNKLYERPVQLARLQEAHEEVKQLRNRLSDLETALVRTRQDEAKQEEQLRTDRRALVAADRAREKSVEACRFFADDEIRESQRSEDAELEEAAQVRFTQTALGHRGSS